MRLQTKSPSTSGVDGTNRSGYHIEDSLRFVAQAIFGDPDDGFDLAYVEYPRHRE